MQNCVVHTVNKELIKKDKKHRNTVQSESLRTAPKMWEVQNRQLTVKGKGKAVPLQARSGPEGSRKLRFQDIMTTAQDGGKVVSLTHRPPSPPGSAPGTYF